MMDFETQEGREKYRRTMPERCMDGNEISVSGYPDAPHISINIEGDPTIWLDVSQVEEVCICLREVKKSLKRFADKQMAP